MIHPRMATMLVGRPDRRRPWPRPALQGCSGAAAARTWDQLSVDGDTSTNDTVFLLASGAAPAAAVAAGSPRRRGWRAPSTRSAGRSRASRRPTARGPRRSSPCQVAGAADVADARARRPGGRLEQPGEGGRPRPRPELGPMPGGGNARLATRRPRGRRPATPTRRAGRRPPATVDPAGSASRSAAHRLRRAGAGPLPSTGPPSGPRWTPRRSSSASTSASAPAPARPWLRPHRGVRARELGVLDVSRG